MKKITRFLFCTFVAIMLMGTAISATACHQKEEYPSVPEVTEPQPTGEIIPTVDRNNHHVESGRDCCIAISPFFCRDLPAYPQAPHLHGNEKTLAQCQDRRFLWGILTSAVLSSLPNGSLPSFTYGWASDAPTFCVLLRIPRLRPPSLPSKIGELRQRKNNQGAETHVFMLAGAG